MRILGRNRVALALGTVIASLAATMAAGAARGAQKIGYVENVHNPEDLVQLSGTRWVVASGRKHVGFDQPGHLYLIDTQTGRSQIVYPDAEADAPTHELDAACSVPRRSFPTRTSGMPNMAIGGSLEQLSRGQRSKRQTSPRGPSLQAVLQASTYGLRHFLPPSASRRRA